MSSCVHLLAECLKNWLLVSNVTLCAVAYPGILFVGSSTNSVEDRENRDLGAVAP